MATEMPTLTNAQREAIFKLEQKRRREEYKAKLSPEVVAVRAGKHKAYRTKRDERIKQALAMLKESERAA
jgi:hypothetical protein